MIQIMCRTYIHYWVKFSESPSCNTTKFQKQWLTILSLKNSHTGILITDFAISKIYSENCQTTSVTRLCLLHNLSLSIPRSQSEYLFCKHSSHDVKTQLSLGHVCGITFPFYRHEYIFYFGKFEGQT